MADNENKNRLTTIPIKSLKSKSSVNDSDILVIEDETTTYKTKASDLLEYAREGVKDTFVQLSQKGIADGVVPLDSNAKIDSSYLSFGETSGKIYDGKKGKDLETAIAAHKADTNNPHKTTKDQVGLGNVENKDSETIRSELTYKNVTDALGFTPEIDGSYENATAYTDQKIAELIGGASSTMDTLKEIEDAMESSADVVEALNEAIGKKANEAELNSHINDGVIHVTTVDKEHISTALSHANSDHARVDATKTEESTINGNIKINDQETTVYEHPLSGATAGTYRQVTVDSKGHVTGGSNTTLPITQGGTGATTAANALKNLGVTAIASELNKLDGVTTTTDELNYVHGVTSGIQTQLDGKAPKNHGLHLPAVTSDTNGKIATSNGTGVEWHELTKDDVVDALGYVPGTGSNVVTAVKGDAEEEYKTGNVNITPASIGLDKVDNTKDNQKAVLSATKLSTARKIGNARFNGTADISLEDMGAMPATNPIGAVLATCETAAATAAKVVTVTNADNWELKVGSEIIVKFTNTNTASNCTLNVNDSGAKDIWYNNAKYTGTSNMIVGYTNQYIRYIYNGTYWVWMGCGVGGASNAMSATNPTGTGSFSLNRRTDSTVGEYSFVEGSDCEASGKCSHAEGMGVSANANYSHSEGLATTVLGQASHAEGYASRTIGDYSHAEGQHTRAIGACSHSAGRLTTASGKYSHASGSKTTATQDCQFVVGYGNDSQTDSIFEVGNGLKSDGTAATDGAEIKTKQNAFRVTQSGQAIAQTGLGIGDTKMTEAQLKNLLGSDGVSRFDGIARFIGSPATDNSQVYNEANVVAVVMNPSADNKLRAGYGFHNAGINGLFLYLDTDGYLKMLSDTTCIVPKGNRVYAIGWKESETSNSRPQVLVDGTTWVEIPTYNEISGLLTQSPFNTLYNFETDGYQGVSKYRYVLYNLGDDNFAAIGANYTGDIVFKTGTSSDVLHIFRMTSAGQILVDGRAAVLDGAQQSNVMLPITGGLYWQTSANVNPVISAFKNGQFILAPNGWNTTDMLKSAIYIGSSESSESISSSTGMPKRIMPKTDNLYYLGAGNYRFSALYASTGTIQTSDRNKKKDIVELPDQLVLKFVMGLKPSSYKLIDGESGRTHYGLIAQDVEDLMDSIGLTSMDFAGFIKSPKMELIDEFDDDGKPIGVQTKVIENEYDLRYEEFLPMIVKFSQIQEDRINKLEKENSDLKARLDKLEAILTK